MPTVNADWLAHDAVVVGYLTIENDGIAFQSVIPNPARAFQIGIDRIDWAIIEPGGVGTKNAIRIGLRLGIPIVFLVGDPRSCLLALEQAIALHKAKGAYR